MSASTACDRLSAGTPRAACHRASHTSAPTLVVMSPPSESVLIDAARHLRRWSALQLARESGLAMGTIQEALSGLRGRGSRAIEVGPSVGTLLVLARTLDLTPEQFQGAVARMLRSRLSF